MLVFLKVGAFQTRQESVGEEAPERLGLLEYPLQSFANQAMAEAEYVCDGSVVTSEAGGERERFEVANAIERPRDERDELATSGGDKTDEEVDSSAWADDW